MSFSGTKGYITKPKSGVMLNPLHPLSRGLVGYWLFNERSGNRAYDISSKGNHGTLKNMSPNVQGSGWGGSKFGGGLSFDGVDDYVDCGSDSSLNTADAITIEAWIKPIILSGNHVIYSRGTYGNKKIIWIEQYNARIEVLLGNGTTRIDIKTSSVLTLNEWSHIIMTFDTSGNLLIYENGVEIYNVNQGFTGLDSDTNAFIGRLSYSPGYFFDGPIDLVRIYNHALSASDVQLLYQNPFCNLLQIPVRRYSVAAPPVGAIMNQFQRANMGADLYNGAIIA